MGPSPQGRRRRPWVPFGPLWVPLVSLAPPLPPWVPPKGSAPCRSDIGASRKFGDGAAFAGENKLGRRACAEREESIPKSRSEKGWSKIEKNRALERPRVENVSSAVQQGCGCLARGVPTLKQRGLAERPKQTGDHTRPWA